MGALSSLGKDQPWPGALTSAATGILIFLVSVPHSHLLHRPNSVGVFFRVPLECLLSLSLSLSLSGCEEVDDSVACVMQCPGR